MTASIPREQVTGLLLAGGRGQRLGGVDKGLQTWHGRPMAEWALQRLAPQVGTCLISANRHLADYAALGMPVLADAEGDFPGPLAGFLAGLSAATTPWLVTVPCDTPNFPLDLVARLANAAITQDCEIAMAATRSPDNAEALRPEPVFCLLRCHLRASLQAYLAQGRRQVEHWARQHACAFVGFEDSDAFFNVNTPDDLGRLRSLPAG
ncbi:molybdenum cofactor guanylyltransferase MobA [Ideonella azotifigens]|uniref:Molybdenum cofactor guanylyltransferase n=1 Tax=Ideonella azotifigens TaxID=513160 RepID=A0ABN1K5J7_9BURK|nr:molybdenum cofactor guanylyltransferase MobA [Ideonella azotifigens]MCD2342417.1 molybdenum cofactor guanylyltransferase MobA [Ideonella azotifigens]